MLLKGAEFLSVPGRVWLQERSFGSHHRGQSASESFLKVNQTRKWGGQRKLPRRQDSGRWCQAITRYFWVSHGLPCPVWLTKHQQWTSRVLPEQESYQGGQSLSWTWVLRRFCKEWGIWTLILYSRGTPGLAFLVMSMRNPNTIWVHPESPHDNTLFKWAIKRIS